MCLCGGLYGVEPGLDRALDLNLVGLETWALVWVLR